MKAVVACFTLLVSLVFILECVNAGAHSYKDGENIKLYANKVGPFNNPRSDEVPKVPSSHQGLILCFSCRDWRPPLSQPRAVGPMHASSRTKFNA
jgi:hypothetical protein